jgi:hypothetical protein
MSQIADLRLIPVPMSESGPASCGVTYTAAGWRLYWLIGTRRELFGPVFAHVRAATAASRELNGRE